MQVEEQILQWIQLGVCEPHAQLPSIREIAAAAQLNFNTVKKAFSELETLGVIYTVPGTGSFVSENALENERLRHNTRRDLAAAITSALAKGLSREDILALLDQIEVK